MRLLDGMLYKNRNVGKGKSKGKGMNNNDNNKHKHMDVEDEDMEDGEDDEDDEDVQDEEDEEDMEKNVMVEEDTDKDGCPRRGLEALSSLGLSVSYDQVRRALRSLTKDALKQVQKAVLENDWYVVYDNINIAMKHHHQRVDKRDTFDNGTAATVILIPNENAKNDKPIPVLCPKTK
ncbi:hypothetical protein BG006_004411, partial [Podila minutissima]